MNQKHRKRNSVAVSSKERSRVAARLSKKSVTDFQEIESLIGKQSVKWSFSKANRFSSRIPEPSAEYLNLHSTIGSGRSAGFGYGKRWAPSNPKGKDAPPPTQYTLPSYLDRSIAGGKISPSKPLNEKRSAVPGPGSYNIKSSIGSGRSCTLKSRNRLLGSYKTPPPGAYNPNHSLVESGRYLNISFGAKGSNDAYARFSTPGPGSYDLGSTFASISSSPSPKRRLVRKNSLS